MAQKTQIFQDESGETRHRQMSVLTFNLGRGRTGQDWQAPLGHPNFIFVALAM